MGKPTKADLLKRIVSLAADNESRGEIISARNVEIEGLRAVVAEQNARLDGMRATNSDKISQLNKLAAEKVKFVESVDRLSFANRNMEDRLKTESRRRDRLIEAMRVIQATSIDAIRPIGVKMTGETLSYKDEQLLRVFDCLRDIIES